MSEPERPGGPPASREAFWRTPAGLVAATAGGTLAIWMVYQHRLHVFSSDALPILVVVLCVGMHLVMHRGHAGGPRRHHHGEHHHGEEPDGGSERRRRGRP
jgi:hypothetical protein